MSPPAASTRRWAAPAGRWLRWGALGLAALMIVADLAPGRVDDRALWLSGAGLAVLALAAALRSSRRGWLTFEAVVALAVVGLTGATTSPYVLYLAVVLWLSVLAWGADAVVLAAATCLVVVGFETLTDGAPRPAEAAALLVPVAGAVAAGLALRRRRSAAAPAPSALGEVGELGHLNALLTSLHSLVVASDAPLSVEDVVAVVRPSLEELFDPDAIVLLLAGPERRWWRSVDAPGLTPVGEIAWADLPAEVLAAGPQTGPVVVPGLGEGGGLTPAARSGLYLWLFGRGEPAALLAVERDRPGGVPDAHQETLGRMATPLALALDNAVWLHRLRTLGADEERRRLGARLHDRFAQDLAYLGMELERAATRHPDDPELGRLRDEVRGVLADLRGVLRDLRARCSEDHGLADALADHLEQAGERERLQIAEPFPRLPVPVEDHLLRAVQDLRALAARRAAAPPDVRLLADDGRVRVVVGVADAVDEARADRETAGLLAGVRDRADAIGAAMDVRVRADDRTEVALTLHHRTG